MVLLNPQNLVSKFLDINNSHKQTHVKSSSLFKKICEL